MTIRKISITSDDGSIPQEVETNENRHHGRVKVEEDNDNGVGLITNELTTINYIEPYEIDIRKSYQDKIHKLVKEHNPKKQVQTNIEMRIVLRDQEPVCLKPRRLSVKEKLILDK